MAMLRIDLACMIKNRSIKRADEIAVGVKGASSRSIEQRIRRCIEHEVNRNDALAAQSFSQLYGDGVSWEFVYFILDRNPGIAFVCTHRTGSVL